MTNISVTPVLISLLEWLVISIPVLVAVAYLTLAERKVLGLQQLRKGPSIVGFYGITQPLADGVKLFSNEFLIPSHASVALYVVSPIIAFMCGLSVWYLMPWSYNASTSNYHFGLLIILAISSLGIYGLLMSGWGSKSKYAFLGAVRAVAQMISYEVSMGLLIMNVVIVTQSYNLHSIASVQSLTGWLAFGLWPVALMMFVSCLAETNRAPFDLTEGESELVSGYNVEYASMPFALFFLAEYSHIIFMSFLMVVLFAGSSEILGFRLWTLCLKGTIVTYVFIWVRNTFPRLRYDQVMHLLWKSYLPLAVAFLLVNTLLLTFPYNEVPGLVHELLRLNDQFVRNVWWFIKQVFEIIRAIAGVNEHGKVWYACLSCFIVAHLYFTYFTEPESEEGSEANKSESQTK